MSEFANRLLLRRKELKLTKKGLSEKTQINAISISYYEKGTALPNYTNLYKLACALELDFNELCDLLKKEKEKRTK